VNAALRPGLGSRAGLPLVLALYLVVATLFAVFTPPWQVPDEPAHYNYVRHLALGHGLPVLQMGDYCQPCLNDLLAQHFPPGMPLDTLDYEFHQPPLYYALAVPVYLAFGGALLPLRLFSVMLGAVLAALAYAALARAGAGRDLTLAATAFVALLPQHVAMLAGVNNDALAEALLAALLVVLLPYLRRPPGDPAARRDMLLSGLLLGLAFWTKSTAYVGAGLIAVAVLLRPQPLRARAHDAALSLGLAALLGLPWWLRNLQTYGGLDFLGLQWHNLVALRGGQPTTAEWLAQLGPAAFAQRMAVTTFQSFWGQFGWMGVVLDARVYYAAALAVGLALGGLALLARDGRRSARNAEGSMREHALLAALAFFAVAAYGWYNLTFVQHQGRYLFTALIPLGLVFAAGWRRVLSGTWREQDVALIVAVAAGAAWYALAGLALGRWAPGVPAAFALVVALLGAACRWVRPERVLAATLAVALAALALFSLFGAIVPQL
jgi:4-amino-4-deoxy-L-arabinose transferase-like glycosyltransferase